MFIAMVATFLYTMRMMNKLNSHTGVDKSGESRSIYDVNAQGNKIKLGDVIPEQFGHFKKFPDYLADAHSFYKDNEYYLDLILIFCRKVSDIFSMINHKSTWVLLRYQCYRAYSVKSASHRQTYRITA